MKRQAIDKRSEPPLKVWLINIGAQIIRIGFWGRFCYNYIRTPKIVSVTIEASILNGAGLFFSWLAVRMLSSYTIALPKLQASVEVDSPSCF